MGWGNERMKGCSNGPGHMTKMATMPIYGKNLKKSSAEPKGRWPWNLVCSMGSRVLPGLFRWWPWVDLDIIYSKIRFGPYAFVWEKGKTMDFSETIVVYDLKLPTDDWSNKKFLLTSKLCPLGAVCPLPPGYIHLLNHEKKLYKVRLQRDFFETCNKWMKWQDISVDIKTLSPGGCLPLPWGYIHV